MAKNADAPSCDVDFEVSCKERKYFEVNEEQNFYTVLANLVDL